MSRSRFTCKGKTSGATPHGEKDATRKNETTAKKGGKNDESGGSPREQLWATTITRPMVRRDGRQGIQEGGDKTVVGQMGEMDRGRHTTRDIRSDHLLSSTKSCGSRATFRAFVSSNRNNLLSSFARAPFRRGR